MTKLRLTLEFDLNEALHIRSGEGESEDMKSIAEGIIASGVLDYAQKGSIRYRLDYASGRPTPSVPGQTKGTLRSNIHIGDTVDIVLKKDQPTGALTRGVVARLLTNSPTHPRGIKVMLEDGQVGRVKAIVQRKDH